MRRSQHVVNYTTTIVIALGIVTGVFIAFYSLASLNEDVDTRCQLSNTFTCDDDNIALSATENTIRLTVSNAGPTPVRISNATATIDQTTVVCDGAGVVEPDGETTMTCQASLVPESPYDIPLEISYHDTRRGPQYTTTAKGTVQAWPQITCSTPYGRRRRKPTASSQTICH